MRKLWIVFFFALLAGCGTTTNDRRPSAKLISYGIYDTKSVEKVPYEGVSKDIDILNKWTLKKQTSHIPCVLGTRFGVQFDLENIPLAKLPYTLDVVWQHPMLVNPSGQRSTESKLRWPFDGEPTWATKDILFDWGLEEAYELQSGTWTISVYHLGQPMLQRSFEVACP